MLADTGAAVKLGGPGARIALQRRVLDGYGMRRGTLVLAVAGIAFVALMAIALWPPQRLDGTGTIYSDFQCVGLSLDEGTYGGPVTEWPSGLRTERFEDEWVLVDDAGEVVLRPGDRISVEAHLTHADGDTACSNTNIITVERFERLD